MALHANFTRSADGDHSLTTCHLTKLETAVEQIKKSHPKMKPTDAALVASALVITGRHALALYDGEQFQWPEDYSKLTAKMAGEVELVNTSAEPVKKTKAAVEEEPAIINVGLMPNFSAGERLLEGRNDLKSKLSDILESGVEFVYSPQDLGWQWALDRANWSTITGSEMARKVRVKAGFTAGAVGVEMGATPKRRTPSRKVAEPVIEIAETAATVEAIPEE